MASANLQQQQQQQGLGAAASSASVASVAASTPLPGAAARGLQPLMELLALNPNRQQPRGAPSEPAASQVSPSGMTAFSAIESQLAETRGHLAQLQVGDGWAGESQLAETRGHLAQLQVSGGGW